MRLTKPTLAVFLSLSAVLGLTPIANGQPLEDAVLQECGRYWPSEWVVSTARSSNDTFKFGFAFRLDQAEIDAITCADEYLEIDFRLHDFGLPPNFDEYAVSSDLPGALHDVNFRDQSPTPAVTRVRTDLLTADQTYRTWIEFQWPDAAADAAVSIDVVPSHWSGVHRWPDGGPGQLANEHAACAIGLVTRNGAWCVFGTTRYRLTDTYYGPPVPMNTTFRFPLEVDDPVQLLHRSSCRI